MNKYENNLAILRDTLDYFENHSDNSLHQAKVYTSDELEQMISKRVSYNEKNMDVKLEVSSEDSYTTALRLREDSDSVLVLNFANPVSPGGGVRRGAIAQEEDLCRKSSLLLSLESDDAKPYYEMHRENEILASHSAIISPVVRIIKDAEHKMLDKPVDVAVITVAAPIKSRLVFKKEESEKVYKELVYNRIFSMITLAEHLGYKNLVLGAWGCGAFGNEPEEISELFCDVLKCFDCFEKIIFSVLARSLQGQMNYQVFKRKLEGNI